MLSEQVWRVVGAGVEKGWDLRHVVSGQAKDDGYWVGSSAPSSITPCLEDETSKMTVSSTDKAHFEDDNLRSTDKPGKVPYSIRGKPLLRRGWTFRRPPADARGPGNQVPGQSDFFSKRSDAGGLGGTPTSK